MARKKLKVKKFRGGGGYQGSKAGPVERPGNYQEKKITGPRDPGIPTESITNIGDNLKARQRAMGVANIIPGAQMFNILGAARDTAVARKAMGINPVANQVSARQKLMQGQSDTKVCPPGYVNVGGQCVKKSSKGGSVKYYKGLL
jgi:hypothetical protein